MASYTGADVMASASDRSAPSSPEPQSSSARDGTAQTAPTYTILNKEIAAVEIPAVVQNIDRAVKAFGRVPSFEHLLDPQRNSIPLYLNPESPFCNPIMSHNSASHNVVLKITVPKRTGRKRKRGSSGPWEGDQVIRDADQASSVCSIARQDEPKILKRKLQDNVGRYKVDAVGIINHTHRFRGLADFYWDMSTSSFTNRYVDQVLSGDVEKMKAFTLKPGIDKSKNSDVIPPPLFTHMSLPFNYFYSQNPYVRTTADGGTVNVTAVKQVGYFISADDPTPTAPQEPPDVTDARFMEVLADLEAAFDDRPIWTRRSLLNHLGKKLDSWNELKKYLNYAAYQFKGGPWRDCVVPYGLDPRTHPKYREYQTVMFKLTKHKRPQGPAAVRTYRRPEKVEERQAPAGATSHIFDGETYDTDGKVWQVCDIIDPLLRELLDGAAVRPTWDISSGWYHGGLWAKVKAIMKTKLVGIRFGRQLSRHDFSATLQFGDMTPPRSTSSNFHLPLPNLRLTDEELTALRGRKPPKKKSQGYNVKLYGRPTASITDGPASVASSPSRAPMDAMENDDDSGADSNEENESGSELDDQLDTLVDDYNGQDYSTQAHHEQNYREPYRFDTFLNSAAAAMDSGPDVEFPCRPCRFVFPTWKLLWAHKCAMRDLGREDHKSCTFCGEKFEVARSELLHVERSHEATQQLSCPGCGRGPFNRVGTLMAHIERGQCTSIGSRDLMRLRESKLDFHRELEKRSNEPVKGSFVSYMSNIHVEPWIDVVEAPSAVKPGVLTEPDFPGLPTKHTQVPQKREPREKTPQEVTVKKQEPQVPTKRLAKKWNTVLANKQDSGMPSSEKPASTNSGGSEWLVQLSPKPSQVTNWPSLPPPGRKAAVPENPHGSPPEALAAKWQGAWGTRDVQASILKDGQKPRVSPTAEQLSEATRPSQMSVAEIDTDDPMNSYFRASNYFNTAISKYVCPKLGCGKYYDNKFQIINHLKSPAHGSRSYQCPRCSHIFTSVEAITSHAESPGHCRIRETEEYGAFLDQITGGIVQVDMNDVNDCVKYNVQKDVLTKCATADTLDSDPEHPFEATGGLGDDRMTRRWARRLERTCCSIVKYFPLLFVYGLTTWAVYTIVSIGNEDNSVAWLGTASSAVGVAIYFLANWSYTVAVFTPAGSTTTTEGYGMLPTAQANRPATSFTVKSNGEMRFCKKCQARKPDRAHHCSTCKRCVLKMDHHCPWLATCVGLRNYKAFLLFLCYTTLLCFYSFAVSGTWVWTQVISGITEQVDNLMPVNYIMLSVMSGIIGIVLAIFTGWHIMLSLRGQTTIECLEKTRYLSPLRRSYNLAHDPRHQFHPVAQQIVDFHTAALPGITGPEEGEEQRWAQDRPNNAQPPPRQRSYAEMEREQNRRRYEEYLDEQDAEKLPSAFDLGWRRNMKHLLGPTPALWFIPICNTTGDGWAWEASPAWLEACDRVRIEREQQRQREINAGWGEAGPPPEPPAYQQHYQPQNYQPQQNRQPASKADRLLGRDPNLYADPRQNGGASTVPLRRLSPRGRTIEQELEDIDNDMIDFDEEAEPEQKQQPRRNGGPARMNSNGSNWGRGGASGMLRSGGSSGRQTPKPSVAYEDEGVD